jgi:toxin ParE1/3/4
LIRLRFTRQAEADIFSIQAYTVKTFGTHQWPIYENGLRTVFLNLKTNPLLGVDRSAVKANVRRLLFHSHAIYYRLDPGEIVVLRILGVKQDPGRHL